MITSLRELVAALPSRSTPFEQSEENRAIDVRVAEVEDYVWPGLRANSAFETESSSPVLLVTAPGAMGKSAAAKMVARSTNGIYVDLARMHVGSGSLTGELLKVLGGVGFETFRQELGAGTATLILDSTDEAQLRAGAESFIEFMRDLSWQLKSSTAAGQVLMFGRADSIDLTYLALEELGIEAPSLEIAPLNYESSCEFVNLQIDRRVAEKGANPVHRVHQVPFGQLRDRVFADLMRALDSGLTPESSLPGEWAKVADFLGYPPVLTALAERLHVENPSEELGRLGLPTVSAERRRRGALLRGIVEQILDRETGKVADAVGERLGIRADDSLRSALFGREEQIARLLRLTGVASVKVSQPAALNENDRGIYDELVDGFVRDHPFLRGVDFSSEVFSDYARAWAVSSPLRGAWVLDEKEFNETLPGVGPFFTHFLGAVSIADVPDLPEWQLDDVLRSHKLGARDTQAFVFQRDELASVLLMEEDDPEVLVFELSDLSGVLELRSPVSRVTVITDMGVKLLPGSNDRVELGPDTVILSDELEIRGTKLVATARDTQFGASTLATLSLRHGGDLTVTAHPKNALAVNFPDHRHQWKPYAQSLRLQNGRLDQVTASQILIAARRILTAFRPSSGETLAVSADKVDRLLVGRNSTFAATRDAMIDLGLITKRGQVYELDLEKMSALDVSWNALRGDDPVRALHSLCTAIVEAGDFPSATT